ncbi:hypothetical protein B566_EDAN007063 [Ephemera danica]|nr:hypothetical protein B566_EDAN007063 [Ephemera danica]
MVLLTNMFSGSHRLLQLNAYDRHKVLINEYLLTTRGATQALKRDDSRDKRDIDVIREHHQFLWDEENTPTDTWELRLAKKYYDKLFKEYCICDLSRYKENKVALRWRIESEVVSGKGQFSCGNKACGSSEQLRSWEVNFAYSERGEKKNALVKLRLCPPCSERLNYHHKKREVKRSRKRQSATEQQAELSAKKPREEKAGEEQAEALTEEASTSAEVDEAEVWRAPATNTTEEKSRDDEFQEYLEDLFL